jgi:hypothetical protein
MRIHDVYGPEASVWAPLDVRKPLSRFFTLFVPADSDLELSHGRIGHEYCL